MTDKNELKRLAEEATPGPWIKTIDGVMPKGEKFGIFGNPGAYNGRANREFIASANPAAVLALIAEIERLSIREDVLENLCDARFRINLDLETERDQLKAENEALRIALKDIRENSTDISACECAADALVDASNSKGDKP